MKQKLSLLLASLVLVSIKAFAVDDPDYVYTLEGNVINQTIIDEVAEAAKSNSSYSDKCYGAIIIPNGVTVNIQGDATSVVVPDGMSIVFRSNAEKEKDRPTLVFPYQLDIAGKHDEIRFENVNLTAPGTDSNKYIINQKTESTTADVIFTGCNIYDVNCAIIRTQGSNAVNIGTVTIDDCVISNQGTMNQSYGYVINAGCTGGTISEVEITNSTFNTCVVGIVYNNTKNSYYISKVKISDCTFYNCIGSGYYLVNAGKDASNKVQPTDITISNVVVGKLYSASAKGYQAGGAIILDYFYQTYGTKFGGGSFKSYDLELKRDMRIGQFSDAELFVDPDNGDFSLRHWIEQTYTDMKKGVQFDIQGDQRWKNPNTREDDVIEVENGDGKLINYQIAANGQVKVVGGSDPYSGDIVIPENITYKDKLYEVTAIAPNAFYECGELTSVTIPSSVTIIGAEAFRSCTGLTSISVPNSVIGIGEYAFANTNLSTVKLSENIEEISKGLFSSCKKLSSVTIPEKVYAIGEYAFSASGITSITIPKNVQYVGDASYIQTGRSRNPFRGCQKLTEIIVEEGNKWYDSRENCNAIIATADNSIVSGCLGTVIPTSVSSIGNYAFYNINKLETITIPDNITKIGEGAFVYCFGLKSVICNIEIPFDLTSYAFTEYEGVTLYVPYGTKEKYLAAGAWKDFKNIVEITPAEIEPIGEVTTIAFEGSDFVSANETPVDLNNTVVNDTYFSINNNSNTDGYYDKAEQCIVINKTTSSEAMQTVVANVLGSADFISNYTGMVIEVNGKGSITISAQTLGSNRLAVKIGSADAKTFAQTEKGDVTVNYDVTENTYVYIYAVDADNQQQSLSMDVTASENAVKVYSITVTPSVTAIESVAANSSDAVFGKIYSIDGKQFSAPQKGLNILRMSDGTTRKIVR